MKRTIVAATAALLMLVGTVGSASAATFYLWDQDFSENTDDWSEGVTHNAAEETATIAGGAFSWFGEARQEWPGDYAAELDVYLDPAAFDEGDGYDYTVAAWGSDDSHQRDFIFHVGRTDQGLRVIANNNTDSRTNAFVLNGGDSVEITDPEAGWYTMQHVFRDDGGQLAVDLKLLDSDGVVVYETTRTTAADTIGESGEVGGNGYAWMIFNDVPLEIDNHELYLLNVTKDDCKKGGFEQFGFKNQGQCIKSVNQG